MEIQDVKQTTELCRYCLMCRHVCPVTAVTQSEATSPHGWGILVASVERGATTWNEDTVNTLYQCADCGLCRAHCVTDQPLPLALNAARADVVNQQLAPKIVYELQEKLERWQNIYQETAPEPVNNHGENVLIVGAAGQYLQPETVAAATRLLAAVGIETIPIAVGRDSAYLANTLGLPAEAQFLAQNTLDEIRQVGAKRVFVLSPGDVYTYTTLLEYLGLSWPAGVELVEVAAFLAEQVEAGALRFNQLSLNNFTFLDPDQTVRVPGRWEAPRKLIGALTHTPPTELFWRKERATPAGVSGALPFTQPELAARLAHARLADARERGIETIITDDPQVLHYLRQQAANTGMTVEIVGLYELLVEQLI